MLSPAQIQEFRSNGLLVVPDVVPERLRANVIDAIIEFSNISLDDKATWYQPTFSGHGIVPLHHHQALWDVRQLPLLHEIFAEIYNTEKLWVSMDRVSYKPPASAAISNWSESAVHWDCDPWRISGLSLQGLVYLTDTGEDQGAFACVPSIFQSIKDYREKHQNDENRNQPVFEDNDLIPVGGKAGSLVLWNRLMPHTSHLNFSDQHRFVQYVRMQPDSSSGSERQQRINEWQTKAPPEWAIRQRISHQLIPEPGAPASLTTLGEKLVGVTTW